MARWRLTAKHYLNVPGTEWEYVEISRDSGKQARVRHQVCMFLDPDSPADQNYPGEIIVANAPSKQYKRDIVFTGPPTPDMEPLDEEAEKITEELKPKWNHPIEGFDSDQGNYSQKLYEVMQKQLDLAIKSSGGVPKMENVSINTKDFEAIKKQVAELTKQNAELLAKLTEKKIA